MYLGTERFKKIVEATKEGLTEKQAEWISKNLSEEQKKAVLKTAIHEATKEDKRIQKAFF
jgi:hypothetical protein